MANGTSFKFEGGELKARIESLHAKTHEAIKITTDFHATEGSARMKTGAPWHDDTGAARAGLHTETQFPRDKYIIVFAHSVDYGIWLEVSHDRKYEIIMPTVESVGHDLMQSLSHLFARLR